MKRDSTEIKLFRVLLSEAPRRFRIQNCCPPCSTTLINSTVCELRRAKESQDSCAVSVLVKWPSSRVHAKNQPQHQAQQMWLLASCLERFKPPTSKFLRRIKLGCLQKNARFCRVASQKLNSSVDQPIH